MLATRVATAVVLVPLVVAGIWLLPTGWVATIVGVLLAVGAWEWARLLGWLDGTRRSVFTLVYALVTIVLAGTDLAVAGINAVAAALLALACVFWLACVRSLLRFPDGWDATLGRTWVGAAVGVIALCASVVAIGAVHALPHGPGLLLTFFVLIWGADTGAYFAGRTLGRHKLAPRVSPGKTVEGGFGGVVTALVVAAIAGGLLGYDGMRWLSFVILGGWIAVISMVGDLTLSMFKRQAEVKDSGALFPGHGGVLDRLDSVLAAAPWFALVLVLLNQG